MAPGGVRVRALVVIAALAFLALAGFAALQRADASRASEVASSLEDARDLRAEVSRAAEAFARALLSYDYHDLPAARTALAGLSTASFMTLYDQEFGASTRRSILENKAVSTARVREVYLTEVGAAEAGAVVVVDSRVESAAPPREVAGSHLKLRLAREGAAWKVREVTVLAAAR